MRPGPWRFPPVRTRFGGLSTIDMKFGSSAGAGLLVRIDVLENALHFGHLKVGLRFGRFLDGCGSIRGLRTCRRSD